MESERHSTNNGHPGEGDEDEMNRGEVCQQGVEESGEEEKDKEEVESDPKAKPSKRKIVKGEKVPKNKKRARAKPVCDNIHGILPTKSTVQSLEDMREECEMSPELEFKVPEAYERPWDCPEGYICLYEAFFSYCLLVVPLAIYICQVLSRLQCRLHPY